jgi:DNA/RNA-binding protein KIN17
MAQVEILDSGPDQRDGGDILDVDQKYLETVVPKDGKRVRIVNGRGRGRLAILLSADHEKCRATLELVDDGSILKKVDFDDFSKVVSA